MKTYKDCCNILITVSTCPLNPFTVEQSGFCYPHFLALHSQRCSIAPPCRDYFKISTIKNTKEEELKRTADTGYRGYRIILTTPAPRKNILATRCLAIAPITGTLQTTEVLMMPEHFLPASPCSGPNPRTSPSPWACRLQEMPARAQSGPFTALLNAISQGHSERGSR